ncbi:hypothetical protein PUN28_006941 [Cardiocondyla obscurior]|uniref:Uncharacterized protein n=1 Tax=Cardiocondyla obscurior TaxID=286306 RepID=A0AAW2G3K4_9HYME
MDLTGKNRLCKRVALKLHPTALTSIREKDNKTTQINP